MYCSKCGKAATFEARYCAACGSSLAANDPSNSTQSGVVDSSTGADFQVDSDVAVKAGGVGAGITGLIFGLLANVYCFMDFSALADSDYSYILPEEIGILAILSIVGIVFGAISASKRSRVGSWALGLSVFALLFTFFLAQYSG